MAVDDGGAPDGLSEGSSSSAPRNDDAALESTSDPGVDPSAISSKREDLALACGTAGDVSGFMTGGVNIGVNEGSATGDRAGADVGVEMGVTTGDGV